MPKFEPGQSGNPGGKPKTRELREALRGNVEAANKRLGELINNKNPRVALLAIKELYDRVYGRALTTAEITVEDNRQQYEPQPLTPVEVAVSIKELLTTAETEMGLTPMPDQSNKDRVERLLSQSGLLPPTLYAALHQAEGTRH
jgi:hypothetical protein